MAESIKDLIKVVEKANKEAREAQERIAENTSHEGPLAAVLNQRAETAREQLKKDDEAIKQRAKLAGISTSNLSKMSVMNTAIGRQEEIMAEQRKELEAIGIDADANKNFRKEQIKLAKMELAQAKSSGSADAEDKAKQKLRDMKSQTFLGSMAKGITNMGKGALKTAAAKLPSLKSLLMTGGLAALLFFLKSPYFVKVKDFIEKEVLPVLANLYDNILVPMGRIFADYFVATWEDIKVLFSDLGNMFSLFGEGKWSEGITKLFDDIVPRLGGMVDKMATTLWNLIATVFGLEETDSVWGTLKGFFTDLYNDVVDWITITWDSISKKISGVFTDVKNFFLKIFSWSSEEDENDSIVVKYIKKAVEGVKKWLGDLFKFDSTSEIIASAFNVVTFLPNIILKGLKLVTGWLLGLFGFDEKAKKLANAEDWSIGSMITKSLTSIVEWLSKLFDFDIAGWIKEKAGMLGKAGSFLLKRIGIDVGGDKKAAATTTETPVDMVEFRKEQDRKRKELRERKAETRRKKAAEKLQILRGEAEDKAAAIAKGTGWHIGGAGGIRTTEKELAIARKELDEMKAKIKALEKASVTAVDAKTITNAPKTTNVTHFQTPLKNGSSAGEIAYGF